MHNCGSITQFQFWHTDVRAVRHADAHIFSAIETIDSKSGKQGSQSKIRNDDRFKVTSGSFIPMLDWLKSQFLSPLLLQVCYRSLVIWLKEPNMCLAAKSDKNIMVADDNWISSSAGDILAILQHAPPFPIPHSCWISAGLQTAFDSSCLVFVCNAICQVLCSA